MTQPRATAINADRHPTETDARNALGGSDRDLPYLGIFTKHDHDTGRTDRLHLFADGVTARQYQDAGWTREDTL